MTGRLLKLALTLALLGAAAPAWGATYYVKQDSAGTYSGNSCDNAMAMVHFNAIAAPGDLALLCDGTFTTMPSPADSGTGWAPGTRITYAGDLSDTNDVILNGNLDITKSYITIKGARLLGSIDVHADACSLAYLTLNSEVYWDSLSHDNIMTNCTARGSSTAFMWGGGSLNECYRDTLQWSVVENEAHSVASESWMAPYSARYMVWRFNRFKYKAVGPAGDMRCNLMRVTMFSQFRHNYWDVASGNGEDTYVYSQRDSCINNTVVGDTIIMRNDASGGYGWICPATDGGASTSNRRMAIDSCYIRQESTAGWPALSCNSITTAVAKAFRLTNSVIVGVKQTADPAGDEIGAGLFNMNLGDSSYIAHNTFFTEGGQPCVQGNGSSYGKFVSNILYRATNDAGCTGTNKYNVVYRVPHNQTNFTSDSNMVYIADPNGGYGYELVGHSDCGNGCCTGLTWDTSQDSHSKNRDPQFADSTFATFDPRPIAGSYALNAYWPDGYVGARSDEGEAGPSLTSPVGGESWEVGSLHNITWSGAGSLNYELGARASLWYSKNSGSTWNLIEHGLAPEDGSYPWTIPAGAATTNGRIKLWVNDDDDNQYGDSTASDFTLFEYYTDSARPDKVRNLWASAVNWTAVTLRWTSPAGDTLKTTVCKYDTLPLAESGANNFRAHGTSVSTGTPSAAGSLDSVTVSGLTPGTRYYFALRHVDNDGDAVGNAAETSLVSIGECRTTRPATLHGNLPASTLSYPLVGTTAYPYFTSAVGDSWPRNEVGWPVFTDMSNSRTVRDSMAKAFQAYSGIHNLAGYGTSRTNEPAALWGLPDSVFKARSPGGLVSAVGHGYSMWGDYRPWPPSDSASKNPDDVFKHAELNNWFTRTWGTAGRNPGGVLLPEDLYLWQKRQNDGAVAGVDDTCTWGAWYGSKSPPCYGITAGTPSQRLNILHRDTTTGELDLVEKQAQLRIYRNLVANKYVASNTYQTDLFSEDYAALNIESRLTPSVDSLDLTRSGLPGRVDATDFRAKWTGAQQEAAARYRHWLKSYRPTGAYWGGNHDRGDVAYYGPYQVDNYEGDPLGNKSNGGVLIEHFYQRRTASTYTGGGEPSLGYMASARRNDDPSPIRWHMIFPDSLPTWDQITTSWAPQWRLGLGVACMFDGVYVFPSMTDDSRRWMSDGDIPDARCVATGEWMWPFFWDESFVDVTTGNAAGWSAWGTGLGKGWLGTPIDDRPKWARVPVAPDTEVISYIGADTLCASTTGWYCYPNFGTMGALGGIDTVTRTYNDGSGLAPNKVFRVRRVRSDVVTPGNINLRTVKAFEFTPTKDHSVRFWAKADTSTTVQVRLEDSTTTGAVGLAFDYHIPVDTIWREYETVLGRRRAPNPDSMVRCRVSFYLADTVGTIYLDNITARNYSYGLMYRRFDNGIVYFNPDSSGAKVLNVAAAFGDTATYDYRNIYGVNGTTRPVNNGRIFGYGTAAFDTIPAASCKFTIKRPNNSWNTFAQGGNFKAGRIPRGRPRGR